MDNILEVASVTKKYKSFTALDSFNMTVPRGSIYGFVGNNGAGKTTLIRLVCGLQTPTSGDIKLNASKKNIGAVVETPSIYLDMTAKDNLKQQYRLLGVKDFSSIDELLKLVGLENAGKKKAKNFSLGMRQRLGIAVALCGTPEFLMLDEPINGLDPQGIKEIRELLIKLNKEMGITILISSHILDELSKLATYYGFISNGKMIREMPAEELGTHESLEDFYVSLIGGADHE